MDARRRAVLALFGSVGIGSGVAYWQRNRFRRRAALDDLETARCLDVPSVDSPISVGADHVAASYRRAREYLRETEVLVTLDEDEDEDEDEESTAAARLERANATLEEHRPDAVTTVDAARHAVLEEYHLAIGECAWVRGDHYGDGAAEPSGALERAIDELDAVAGSIDVEYRGSTPAAAIVHGAEADRLREQAGDACEAVRRFVEWSPMLDGRPSATGVWESVAVGTARLRDANRFLRDRSGPDRIDHLGSAFNRLVERTETYLAGVRWEYGRETPSDATSRWHGGVVLGTRTDSEEHLESERPALAVTEQASAAMIAASLEEFEEFEDVPDRYVWDEVNYRAVDDSESFVAAKRAAIREIETVANEHGANPLARTLLIAVVDEVRDGDTVLERLRSNWWSVDDAQWTRRRNQAYLRYRGAEAPAAAIPTILEEIPD